MDSKDKDSQSNNALYNSAFIYQENEIFVNDTFALLPDKKLGSGAFGELFSGYIIEENKEIALKLESNNIKHPQLYYETKIYKHLRGGSKLLTFI